MTKILLVEDDEMNRDMLSRRLLKRNYEVVIATDGEQGVAMAGSENPDLILMDMSLPGIDGWTATRQVIDSVATRVGPDGIDALAISNQRETIVAWDAETGAPVGPAILPMPPVPPANTGSPQMPASR